MTLHFILKRKGMVYACAYEIHNTSKIRYVYLACGMICIFVYDLDDWIDPVRICASIDKELYNIYYPRHGGRIKFPTRGSISKLSNSYYSHVIGSGNSHFGVAYFKQMCMYIIASKKIIPFLI